MSSSCVVSPSVRKFVKPISHRFIVPSKFCHLRRSKCEMNRRGFTLRGVLAFGVSVVSSSLTPESVAGRERLQYKPEGYNFWTWQGHRVHYVVQGEGFPIVLIHGFGASAFHWRYNIPELAKKYKVYAIDLLGFGWSDKAIIEYDAMIWRDQIVDFLKEIVREPTVLVGNSLGGFTALASAVSFPEQVVGLALLNSAGQFGDVKKETKKPGESNIQKVILKPLKELFQRVFLGFLFWQSKQPARIESVLKSVSHGPMPTGLYKLDFMVMINQLMQIYINKSNVDDYIVESIRRPAADPNAAEVYYRLMTRFILNQTEYTLDSLLSKLSCPLLLLWGDLDPWVGPAKAIRIKEFYPNTTLVNLQAGHCPHDEVPEIVNKALMDWLPTVSTKASPDSPYTNSHSVASM